MREVVLEGRDVTCGYDAPVLEHVNLAIERGEVVAILGSSGSGKSTLMRALIGLLPPLSGEVWMFGRSLYALDETARQALLRRLGVVFQQDALFSSLTIEDNLALPLRDLTSLPEPVIRQLVRIKLEVVGLGGLEHRLPSQLSGGQRKRAALARASIMDPELIACDEPTAGLDPVVSAGIDAMLLRARDLLGGTMVVVSHELTSIHAIASRAVMLADGAIHATGTVDELARSADPQVFEFFHARAR